MNVPLRGTLRDFSLSRILTELNRERATGTLSVTTPRFTKSIYVKDGGVIFASSTVEDDRLGEMLVKAGKISLEQYDKSAELLKTSKKRQGAILVDLGYITPKDLFWGVKYQVKEIICSMFQIEDGAYEFNENAVPPDEVITLKVSMNNLICEGVSRIGNITSIRREMPDVKTVFRLNTNPAGIAREIDLSSLDKTILSLVDGKRSINQVIEESRVNSFDVMKTLYVLWSTGFIVEGDLPGGASQEETVNIGEEILESVAEDDRALKGKVEELYQKLPALGPAELLQISEHSTVDEIKRNYYRLAKEFHPDKVYRSGDAELRDKITVIFDTATKAYDTMMDEARRSAYFRSLGTVRKEGEDTHAALVEEQLRRGVEEFKSGNYWGAAELFRLVTRKLPKKPKAWSYLSLALSKIPNRLKEAEEALLQAIKLEPFNAQHYTNLGHLYLGAGLMKRAHHQFEKALRLDPGNTRAKKGLDETQQSPEP
jgi:tetratricopeptide (TPR) repeat protein